MMDAYLSTVEHLIRSCFVIAGYRLNIEMRIHDNAPDPGARHLKSFPHHKHTKDGVFEESRLVTLSEVMDEIQNVISKAWEF